MAHEVGRTADGHLSDSDWDAPWASARLRRSVPLGAQRTLRVRGTFVKSVSHQGFHPVGAPFTCAKPAYRTDICAGKTRYDPVRGPPGHAPRVTATAPTVRFPRRKIR